MFSPFADRYSHARSGSYLREKSSGYYSASAYFVSMVLTDVLFLRLVPPVLLSSVMYWMCGLHPGTSHFLWFTALLVFTAFTGQYMCFVFVSVLPVICSAVSICVCLRALT